MQFRAHYPLYPYCIIAFIAAILCAPAFADDDSDPARKHLYEAALSQIDGFLIEHPHDSDKRLLKGFILGEQGRTDEAITTYTALIEEFPALPQPYNNLAVLLASSGQYGKARMALETATRIDPHYAIAQENLGDLYAKLALRSYAKALQSVPDHADLKLKLGQVYKLIGNSDGRMTEYAIDATTTPTLTSANPIPVPEMVKPVLAPAPAPVPVSAMPANGADEREKVLQTVQNWAQAWSQRDVKKYLRSYADDFQPADGASRAEWEAQRRARIGGKSYIKVSVNEPRIDISEDKASVEFRQIYTSETFRQENRKILSLGKRGESWQIVQEHTEN